MTHSFIKALNNNFKFRFLLSIFFVFAVNIIANGQEKTSDHDEEKMKRNRISFMMAYGLIPESGEENSNTFLFVVPTIGLNYDFLLTKRWGIGVHTDLILQQFEIEEFKDQGKIDRVFPFTITAMGTFKLNKHWTVLGGVGTEIEKTIAYNLMALGLDYGIELRETWEVSFNMMFEHRFKAYNSFILGVGFSKLF